MTQALIAAAGIGKRFFENPNGLGKQFIEINGKPLIEYVIEDLIKKGVTKILIVANKNNHRLFVPFENKVDLSIVIDKELKGVSYYPYLLEDKLPEQYFYVYGHQPITPQHLQGLENITQKQETGVSVYQTYEKNKRISVDIMETAELDFCKGKYPQKYIGAPYLLFAPPFIKLSRDDQFRNWLGYYIKQAALKLNLKVKGILASMPPEMDFKYQLPSLIEFLKKRN